VAYRFFGQQGQHDCGHHHNSLERVLKSIPMAYASLSYGKTGNKSYCNLIAEAKDVDKLWWLFQSQEW
jgi:hypothetical protein